MEFRGLPARFETAVRMGRESAGPFYGCAATKPSSRLELIPNASLRDRFLPGLARQATADDPPFELDYWRLNLDARKS
jgi:hypothetical protein